MNGKFSAAGKTVTDWVTVFNAIHESELKACWDDEVSPSKESAVSFVGGFIFGYFTGDAAINEFLTIRTLRVCEVVLEQNAAAYIARGVEEHVAYMSVLHMPFLYNRLNWEIEITEADFDECSYCFFGLDEDSQWGDDVWFTASQWRTFVSAVLAFSKQYNIATC